MQRFRDSAFLRLGFCSLVVLLLAFPSLAQTGGAAVLAGTVRDASGAGVPDVVAELNDVARGLIRTTRTNEDGAFLFPALTPALYTLRVSREGFAAQEFRNISLEVGQRANYDVELRPGQVTTVLTVAADTLPQLETESNAIGTVVNSARVQELPLNGRNFLQLALLSGGAVSPTGRSDAIGGQTGRSDNAVILGGNVGSSTGYLINGIATRGGRLGESALNISPAAIDQFKVQMSFFMPDQGPNPGLVNLTTRSGANRFHGELFEFFRNEKLDARNFFAPGPEKLHRNQFGGSFSGPLRTDRTWFFGHFEGLREITAFSSAGYTPTAAMFSGDFRAISETIYDPATYNPETRTRQPFPGNVIPANRINPVSQSLLAYYLPGSSVSQVPNNVFANPRRRNDDDQYSVRVDHSLSSTQTAFAQYIRQRGTIVAPGLTAYSGSLFPLETDYATVQHTWTLTPALINNLRAGFVRNSVFTANEGSTLGSILPDLGITNTLDPRGISGVSLQGYSGFGRAAGNIGNIDNSYQLDDGLYLSRGTHSYQFGASLRHRRTWQQNANASAVGNLTFQPQFTAQLAPNAQGQLVPQARTGNSFADFLLGVPATAQMIGLPLIPYRFTQFNPYLQDTWKVTRNFTLNYGIAWFLSTVPEPVGWAAQLPHALDESTGLLRYAALGEVDPRVLTTNWKNFTPRLGFAWRPALLTNTVIRAGAGTFYADTKLIEAQFAMVAPPFNTPVTANNPNTNPVPQFVLGQNIFSAPPTLALDSTYASQLPNGTTAFILRESNRTPYVNQWNFSVQHSVRPGDLFEVVYMGASGHNQQHRYEGNQCRVGPDLRCDPATRPYPRYSSLLTADFNGNSSYNAFIARYHHQSVGGLDFRFEYTFGKAINDHFQGGANDSQVASCRACDRAAASFDVKHRAVASVIYNLPFGRGRTFGRQMHPALEAVAGNWVITGIGTFATGQPFDVTAPNTTGFNNITHRANRLCHGRSDELQDNLRTNGLKWFDTNCFAAPPAGYYGNAARNVLYGPGVNNWDIGLEKNWPLPLGEGSRLQLRGEFFNAFNHAQFGQPNSGVASPTFGLISSARPPRLIQLGMRLLF
ncbi:MAG TPA: carboxypeptidase-like regulatory domain-containing protein [Bryobacteraceae bacterium]|nr:carboxypeptidase-like regulatory domain-containing protein [Bryobacteraceae bacterium]